MAIKNKYSNIDLTKYNQGYQKSADVLNAQRLKEQAEEAVRNHGAFNYSNQDAYQSAMDAILNRKEFSYDLNGDALYQQYKNMYSALGKQAMTDTMGKAAALTGGYGNSYAATAGNQAYLGYMQQLGAIVPELYNLALSAYNAEGDRLNNNFNLLSTDRNTQYGEWSDRYNQLVNDRGYYGDNYNNAFSQDYNMWSDNRDYDTSQYWNEYNAGYQADRDAITDAQWQKQFDESVRQFNVSSAKSGSKGSGTTKNSSIPDYVLEKAETFTNDASFAAYLDDITAAGAITEEQADMLYANFKGTTKKPLVDREWTVTDDGGWNWFNGVDNNAVLQDQYETSYTAKELKQALIKEGMSEKEANAFLKNYGVYK
jgi:hypothetical protein